MFRNAIRQSSRAVGAASTSGRVVLVSSNFVILGAVHVKDAFDTAIRVYTPSSCLRFQRESSRQGETGLLTTTFYPQTRSSAPAVFNATTKQARTYAADAKASPTEVSSILEQRIRGVQEEAGLAETGRVLSVGYA